MKRDTSTFLKSATGKAVMATGVVLLAFGGVAAAGFDVPTMSRSNGEPTLQDESSGDSSSEAHDQAGPGSAADLVQFDGARRNEATGESREESSQDESSEARDDSSSQDESSDESSDDRSTDEPTHGDVVSDFARTTELEGCEKGQAISDLASSNAADHRQNPESDHNPCDHEGDDESSDDSAEASEVEAPESSDDGESTDDSPGQSGESHGQSGESHGQSGESHGQSGESHGQSGESHGQSGEHGHGGSDD